MERLAELVPDERILRVQIRKVLLKFVDIIRLENIAWLPICLDDRFKFVIPIHAITREAQFRRPNIVAPRLAVKSFLDGMDIAIKDQFGMRCDNCGEGFSKGDDAYQIERGRIEFDRVNEEFVLACGSSPCTTYITLCVECYDDNWVIGEPLPKNQHLTKG